MAAGGVPRMRLRLEFTKALHAHAAGSKVSVQRCWYVPPDNLTSVGELAAAISNEFGVVGPDGLQLHLDGFAVLPASPIDVIRDGDCVKVQRAPTVHQPKPAAAAAAGAASGWKRKAVAAAAAANPAKKQAASVVGRKATARPAAAVAAPVVQPAAQRPGASAAAKPSDGSSSEESTSEESSSEEEAGSSSEESSSSEEENEAEPAPQQPAAAAVKKQPSRNARRKAAKRRLRREGLLPGGSRPATGGAAPQPSSSTAAASAPAAATPTAPAAPSAPAWQPPAPIGGTKWQRQAAAAAPAAAHPHMHFGDSDNEAGAIGRAAAPAAAQALPPATAAGSHAAAQDTLAEPEEPQYNAQPWDYSRHKDRQQKKAGRLGQLPPGAVRLPGPPQQQDNRPRPLPPVDASRLQLLAGDPQVGDVLAYRLLEISADFTPQVSPFRQGKVVTFDEGGREISLEPWPRPTIHPVWAERAAAEGCDYYEYVASLQQAGEGGSRFPEVTQYLPEPPSEYAEDGSLTTAMASLAEVRAVTITLSLGSPSADRSGEGGSHAAAAAPQQTGLLGAPGTPQHSVPAAPAATVQTPPARQNGPPAPAAPSPRLRSQSEAPQLPPTLADAANGLSTPRLGSAGPPPRLAPGSAPGRVPSLSEWGDLSRQLQCRRAELAANGGSPAASLAVATPTASNAASGAPPTSGTAATGRKQVAAPKAKPASAASGSKQAAAAKAQPAAATSKAGGATAARSAKDMAPGAVPPRGGIRHSAMGSLLRRLRAEEAEQAQAQG